MNEMALLWGSAAHWLMVICYLFAFVAEGIATAVATKGLSDRPLETFGAVTPMLLELFCYFGKRGWCGYPVDKHAGIA
jgi:hypothetical protein